MARANSGKQETPLSVVGSSTFGRYPKMNSEMTMNMFVADDFLIPYAGYEVKVPQEAIGSSGFGRCIFHSVKYNKLFHMVGNEIFVYIYNTETKELELQNRSGPIASIGTSGFVWVDENNHVATDGTPPKTYHSTQVAFVTNNKIVLYREKEGGTPDWKADTVLTDLSPLSIVFHNTRFLVANGHLQNNTWRLSANNNGESFPTGFQFEGGFQSKIGNIKAVVRFPSKSGLIFVLGDTGAEAWFDTGGKSFPYQRNNQFNSDYGCLSSNTIAFTDQYVVWLGANEKSGPVVLFSEGGPPQKISTDGLDYLLGNLKHPEDSQAFIFRQDGHVFYHINFYTDNCSFFYDFNTGRFYNACNEDMDYFEASSVCYAFNSYWFYSNRNGHIYRMSSDIYTFNGREIPRIRICNSIRQSSQNYFRVSEVGFTIETGETDYYQQSIGPIYLNTQDMNKIVSQDQNKLIAQQGGTTSYGPLSRPRVDLTISGDGGMTFGNAFPQYLPGIGQRKNKLCWYQIGAHNDFVAQFRFNGFGRFVVSDGVAYIGQ